MKRIHRSGHLLRRLLPIAVLSAVILGGLCWYFGSRSPKLPVLPVKIEYLPAEPQPETAQPPAGEIVLISRYVNYAWGYDDDGFFVDSAGYLYTFDFRAEYGGLGGRSDLAEKLRLVQQWTLPAARVEPTRIAAFMEHAARITDRESYRSQEKMYDYGEKQLLFRNPDSGALLLLGEWGDVDRTLTDMAATAAIADGNAISAAAHDIVPQPLRLYTPEDVPFLKLSTADGGKGRYLLRSWKELRAFADDTGTGVDAILTGMDTNERERYAFFVDFSAQGEPQAILCRGGQFGILTDSGEPACIVAAFPQAGWDLTQDAYTDLAGNPWEIRSFICE